MNDLKSLIVAIFLLDVDSPCRTMAKLHVVFSAR